MTIKAFAVFTLLFSNPFAKSYNYSKLLSIKIIADATLLKHLTLKFEDVVKKFFYIKL